MSDKPKLYGRAAYDERTAAVSDAQLAHKEIVAGLEWLERGQLATAIDRLHLSYRFLAEILVRAGRIESEDNEDERTG
jgi:hypothetical protein